MARLFAAVVPLILLSSLTIPGLFAAQRQLAGSIAAPGQRPPLSSDVSGRRTSAAVMRKAAESGPWPSAVWTNPALVTRLTSPPPAAPVVAAPVTTAPVHAAANGAPLGTFMVTCYDLSGTTASGAQVGPDTVAVDPSIIPLGSRIYVDGAGARIAQDTGGAILGRHLDIWAPSESQCLTWGVQSRQVWMES